MSPWRAWVALVALLSMLLPAAIWAQAGKRGAYQTRGQCEGFPALDLQTPPGVCVGLVMKGLRFPRGIVELPSGDLLVVEMGGWVRNTGAVSRLRRDSDGVFAKTVLLTKLDRPNGIALGPGAIPYVGVADRIIRFDPQAADPAKTIEAVTETLSSGGEHPLKSLRFGPDGALYVNVGSETDHCEGAKGAKPDPKRPCPELEPLSRAGIVRVDLSPEVRASTPRGAAVSRAKGRFVAGGLRNSMALVFHDASGNLIQAENSRDAIERADPTLNGAELPHDELNVVPAAVLSGAAAPANYGWPYCYDGNRVSPEYAGRDCSKARAPAVLLPAHVAPLGMLIYRGSMLPSTFYRGHLVVGFHGYAPYGHRVVVLGLSAGGNPEGPPRELIAGWDKSPAHPQGAPVDLFEARDGSIYVTEDLNGTVLRVAFREGASPDAAAPPEMHVAAASPTIDPAERARCAGLARQTDLFSGIETKLIDLQCATCHGQADSPAGGLWLRKCDSAGNAQRFQAEVIARAPEKSALYLRLTGAPGFPKMPTSGLTASGGLEPDALLRLVRQWIDDGAPVPRESP